MVITAGEGDSKLIVALLGFVEQARLGLKETGLSLENWMRTDHPAAGLLEALSRDPLIAATTKAGVDSPPAASTWIRR